MPNQRTVTIISVTRPVRILTTLKDVFQFKATDEPGVYRYDRSWLPIWIIHPTELAIKPRNYPLLPLARGEKLEQFLKTCYEQELENYLRLTRDIGQLEDDRRAILSKIVEAFRMTPTTQKMQDVTWQFLDQSLHEMTEAKERLPTFIEDIVAQYKPEWFQRGKSEGRADLLLNQLRKKFGAVPETVIQQVRATKDSAQLDQWAERILFVSTLEDMGFENTT